MNNKSLKICLTDAMNRSKISGNNDHFEVLNNIINKIKTIVRAEEMDDDAIIQLENDLIKKHIDDIILEKKKEIEKFARKNKYDNVEFLSKELAVIEFYYNDCCSR